ncbi:MAG TPA: xylulose 5-phosphate 3-epimerase, partial [Hyphomonas sp.]|nr:xylulose 5-phosphate 3-epimerase [Hyphomonas sp.]
MLEDAVRTLSVHKMQNRVLESQNALAVRKVSDPVLPRSDARSLGTPGLNCAMDAIDQCFTEIVRANPHLRVRVANPDELRSNHMPLTLEM